MEAVHGGAAGADDADGVAVAGEDFAPDVEEERWVVGVAEGSGVAVVVLGDDGDAAGFGLGDFGDGVGVVLPGGEDFRGFGADAVDACELGFAGVEDGGGVAEGLEEAADADRADFREEVEGDEGFERGHGVGKRMAVRGGGVKGGLWCGFAVAVWGGRVKVWGMGLTEDRLGRGLRDLRISVTDRCNFRCRYCMPVEVFGPGYAFLPKEDLLGFEEIVRLVRVMVGLGVGKVRLTGGEPLLRRGLEDLVAMIAAVDGVEDLAMTTNGVLLAHHAEGLALAGLKRVTVSLDALDPEIFARMNGVGARVDRVLAGVDAARVFGLPVKVNAVIQRGVNEGEILPMARWAKERGVDLRFIEYMDVGESNGWEMGEVVSGEEILGILRSEFSLDVREEAYRGEVAAHWRHVDGSAEIGLIRSVTRPFCRDCQRLRLSADGKLFTCLFSAHGHDIRGALRGGFPDEAMREVVSAIWRAREDRYSEERGGVRRAKAEMSYLGG